LDGTGLDREQILHTHVAVPAGAGSRGGARIGLSVRWAGEDVPLPETKPGDRGWRDDRFAGFANRVTLAEDLRKPAYRYG
jgi:hypothetical protein